MTRLVYFASVRERVGLAEEEIALPDAVVSVADLLAHLKTRGEGYAEALADETRVRVALDRMHAEHDEPVAGVREIALFPPMTGG